MANVFDKIGDIRNDVRQNSYDWTHDNNLTTQIGRITPIFCDRVPPKSSFRIKPTFGLQFMPMMFPIQTKMKAYLSFYKVPLRTLWSEYQDFISSPNEESNLEAPYYAPSAHDYEDGGTMAISGLADYLGVPLTGVTGYPSVYAQSHFFDTPYAGLVTGSSPDGTAGKIVKGTHYSTANPYTPAPSVNAQRNIIGIPMPVSFVSNRYADLVAGSEMILQCRFRLDCSETETDELRQAYSILKEAGQIATFAQKYSLSDTRKRPNFADLECLSVATFNDPLVETDTYIEGTTYGFYFEFTLPIPVKVTESNSASTTFSCECGMYLVAPISQSIWRPTFADSTKFNKVIYSVSGNDVQPITTKTTPYVGSDWNSDGLKLSAYPFRAYEAVYNAYIRNIKNNPFKINGKPVYNKWITNDQGGKDTTRYSLYYANWASDAYTTALPSPQQGKAPLVGITTYSETVSLDNGHEETKLKFAVVDEDGTKYGLKFESNGDELKNVEYTTLNQDTPVRAIDNLYNLATSGISINDFRNVNAYQRYLELNQFRGFSYKDIIEGRFDVNIKYDALQMPEYIGGLTRDVIVNPITQTVETSSTGSYVGSLGSQAGLAQLRGESDASISVFCDEESIILGLLTVVPMPVYTQVLPKHFLYRDRLDSFNPEFDHIGYQPIYYSELAPVEYFVNRGTAGINTEVFGYQRPWYEYCQKLDTAHGLFRTQLRNFLMNRVFSGVPELSSSFTTVDPNQINDVFSVTETTDKIMGQVHLDMTAKLPISRVVKPKLE